MKKTQEQFVIEHLTLNGEVSRNTCLQNYITRLGAIMCDLKKEGWEFTTYKLENIKPDGKKGYDFIYKLIKLPNIVS